MQYIIFGLIILVMDLTYNEAEGPRNNNNHPEIYSNDQEQPKEMKISRYCQQSYPEMIIIRSLH